MADGVDPDPLVRLSWVPVLWMKIPSGRVWQMKTRSGRGFAVILVAWGLFNMSVPLWLAAEATQASGSFAELPMSYPGMGFTSFLVGMALWVVLDRVEELSREIADWRARGVGIPEAAGDRRGNRG